MYGLTKNATLEEKNATLEEENAILEEEKLLKNIELKVKEQYPKLRDVYIDIIKVIYKNEKISQKEISNILKKDRSSIYRGVTKLQELGILEKIGTKRSGYWKINI